MFGYLWFRGVCLVIAWDGCFVSVVYYACYFWCSIVVVGLGVCLCL